MLSKEYIEKHLEAITTDTKSFFLRSDQEIELAVKSLEKKWRKRPKSWGNNFKLGGKND